MHCVLSALQKRAGTYAAPHHARQAAEMSSSQGVKRAVKGVVVTALKSHPSAAQDKVSLPRRSSLRRPCGAWLALRSRIHLQVSTFLSLHPELNPGTLCSCMYCSDDDDDDDDAVANDDDDDGGGDDDDDDDGDDDGDGDNDQQTVF